jgi:Protein of unknown function (DUF1553)/Protein of unknown function (DUF1549)/Planctomycete cytochrome C
MERARERATQTGPLRRLPWLAILWLAGMACPTGVAAAEDPRSEPFFENRVRPVLAGVCLRCHGQEKQKGGLRFDSRDALVKGGESGPAIDLNDPDQSLLLQAIRRSDDVSAMPPDEALPGQQVADLTAWVKAGSPWPARMGRINATAHWAFQPIRDVAPPVVNDKGWVQTSVDRFILARLDALGHKPAPPADRRNLLRRLTHDLTGLPPTYAELIAFEQDTSPRAFEAALDRLLASPHYGEHWGRHWLDVARYADTAGETADIPVPLAWRYRNYVIDAFNTDKPYDQFLREQIAGDILADAGPRERYAERATATGYLAISRRFGFDSENYHHLTIQDTIDTLGQTVLGLSLGCARCHDHKFDPVSMKDYYALYGIFDSSRYAFPGSEQKQQVRAMLPLVPPNESQVLWREFDARVSALASEVAKHKQPVPKAVLRSLHDADGDFELQAPAAGGSNGVLVQPWLYEGIIAVTTEAQSPYRNLYSGGKVGVSVPAGAGEYRIGQAIYPQRSAARCKFVHVNLDFRVAPSPSGTNGQHRFWIGAQPNSPAVELVISEDAISFRSREKVERIAALQAKEWYNLQLTLDLQMRTVSGSVSTLDRATAFAGKRFSPEWPGQIDLVALDSLGRTATDKKPTIRLPGVEFDNVGIVDWPIPSVSTAALAVHVLAANRTAPDNAALKSQGADAAREQLNILLKNGPFAMTYGMAEGTPHAVRMQMRGEPDQPGDLVARGLIKALGGGALAADQRGSGRLELAQWLTRSDNPLTARVMVNRIWQYHFGHGLVSTPNDFGVRGQPPSHPELLDHLAARFIEAGWSIKAMHRLIVRSATYQQSSTSGTRDDVAAGETSGTDCFTPFARRRLSAEEIRDAILATSGELDRTVAHAHPFPSPISWGFTQHAPFSAVYDHDKRSVYLMTQRIKRHPFLALFDGADPNASTALRQTTTVPTQALFFLNDPFVHTKAEKYARRLQAARPDLPQRIELAWRDVLGRSPTAIEKDEALRFLDEYRQGLAALKRDHDDLSALAAYVRTLFGSNDFIYLD